MATDCHDQEYKTNTKTIDFETKMKTKLFDTKTAIFGRDWPPDQAVN